jgi:hypothetical protein
MFPEHLSNVELPLGMPSGPGDLSSSLEALVISLIAVVQLSCMSGNTECGAAPTAVSTEATVFVGVLEWLLFLHQAPVQSGWHRLGAADGGGGGVEGALSARHAESLIFLLGEPARNWSSNPGLGLLQNLRLLSTGGSSLTLNFFTSAFTFILVELFVTPLINVLYLLSFILVFILVLCVFIGSIPAYFFSSPPGLSSVYPASFPSFPISLHALLPSLTHRHQISTNFFLWILLDLF